MITASHRMAGWKGTNVDRVDILAPSRVPYKTLCDLSSAPIESFINSGAAHEWDPILQATEEVCTPALAPFHELIRACSGFSKM